MSDMNNAKLIREMRSDLAARDARLAEVEQALARRAAEAEELRTRLVEEHEGNSGYVEAESWEKQCHEAEGRWHDARARVAELEGEVARLREALEPFARLGEWSEAGDTRYAICHGKDVRAIDHIDFQAARAALSPAAERAEREER